MQGGAFFRVGQVLQVPLAQEKTGALLDIPCHIDLRAILSAAPRRAAAMCITRRGRPMARSRLTDLVLGIRQNAGLDHLQLRNLRRTAVVNMSEAGATGPEMAAVMGHSIDHMAQIIATYLPTNLRLARAAITELVRNK